jgi:hypothetical protein
LLQPGLEMNIQRSQGTAPRKGNCFAEYLTWWRNPQVVGAGLPLCLAPTARWSSSAGLASGKEETANPLRINRTGVGRGG